MHKTIEPKILYFGTPVLLIATANEDGTSNLAPISSVWWLDQFCMIGMGASSKTVENLRRQKECTLNLASEDMVGIVDKLALTTGTYPVPEGKAAKQFEYVHNKFKRAGLSQLKSDLIGTPRVKECPVNLEALVKREHHLGTDDSLLVSIELEIIRTHIEEELLNSEKRHYIDSDKWKPLIMNFCEFYTTGNKIHKSRLAEVF